MEAVERRHPITTVGDRMTDPNRAYDIAVLHRALDLLDALAAADEPLGATELAREIGATKSATFRILVNLERRGYVRKEPVSARYRLGPSLVSLGYQASNGIDLLSLAHPHLESLSSQLQETANLGAIREGEIVYLDIVESPRSLRMAARIGARDLVHSTALGKAILAFMPDEQRQLFLASPLTPRTGQTITDIERLGHELTSIRREGFARETGENEPDARCVGAPVFDRNGICAALSISGPASRMDDQSLNRASQAVLRAAAALSAELGGTWPSFPEAPQIDR
jgi:IclR family acetate operon transcriptional repressor